MVLEAIQQSGGAFECASKELKLDKEFFLDAAKQPWRRGECDRASKETWREYGYVSDEIKEDMGAVLGTITQDWAVG